MSSTSFGRKPSPANWDRPEVDLLSPSGNGPKMPLVEPCIPDKPQVAPAVDKITGTCLLPQLLPREPQGARPGAQGGSYE